MSSILHGLEIRFRPSSCATRSGGYEAIMTENALCSIITILYSFQRLHELMTGILVSVRSRRSMEIHLYRVIGIGRGIKTNTTIRVYALYISKIHAGRSCRVQNRINICSSYATCVSIQNLSLHQNCSCYNKYMNCPCSKHHPPFPDTHPNRYKLTSFQAVLS